MRAAWRRWSAPTAKCPAQGSVQALLEAVVTWHGNGRLRDDVSILAAEVLG